MTRFLIVSLAAGLAAAAVARPQPRWDVSGHHAVSWNNLKGGVPHADHIEMAGRKVAVVYRWSVDGDGAFHVNRHLVFPSLRTIPNDTHASWMPKTDVDFTDGLTLDRRPVGRETVRQVTLDGKMRVVSVLNAGGRQVQLTRLLWPSTTEAALCEDYVVSNMCDRPVALCVPSRVVSRTTNKSKGVTGAYRLVARTAFEEDLLVELPVGGVAAFACSIQGYAVAGGREVVLDNAAELRRRQAFVDQVTGELDFTCPDPILNTMFAMAKIRLSESICDTPAGPMHAPGGTAYYAAMWCNDQAEYANPFFPFLGYALGNESAMTTWNCYLRQINPEFRYVPWSIICGGADTFGLFDRGDAAMLAYGASRYCLARGDREIAARVWPLIEWCLEYCRRKLTKDGVVASDADELERRLPAGDANLCTSTLYYDALISAAHLCRALKIADKGYVAQAETLRANIRKHFSATVEGYETYRYYAGNDKLRSWIAIPLTMGIYDRAEGTIRAMFGPELWSENGMLSISGDKIFWDRSTLYGLRGTFAAGAADIGLEQLRKFSVNRLVGEHVPYVVEAWPEGGKRHLSAENALYCRIYTEGLLGFRPTGFASFSLTPQMPAAWDAYSFARVHACRGKAYDIAVKRASGDDLTVTITGEGKVLFTQDVRKGATIQVDFAQVK